MWRIFITGAGSIMDRAGTENRPLIHLFCAESEKRTGNISRSANVYLIFLLQ